MKALKLIATKFGAHIKHQEEHDKKIRIAIKNAMEQEISETFFDQCVKEFVIGPKMITIKTKNKTCASELFVYKEKLLNNLGQQIGRQIQDIICR